MHGAGRGGGVRRLRHLQVGRSRRARARHRARHHALAGPGRGGGGLARAGRADARASTIAAIPAAERLQRARLVNAAAVGVLALQGDFAAHARVLARAGRRPCARCAARRARRPRALVLPGGESTALLHLHGRRAVARRPLRAFHRDGRRAARHLRRRDPPGARRCRPAQPLLRRCSTSTSSATPTGASSTRSRPTVDAPALRGAACAACSSAAPRFRPWAPASRCSRASGRAGARAAGRVLGATFHPELTGDDRLHRRFLAQA